MLPVAIHAGDPQRRGQAARALARLAVEDTTVRLERTVETDQIVLWTMGQGHVDLLLNRLVQRYGVKVAQEDIKVPLRETFVAKTSVQGRHVKQSGGHGQYAVCQLEIEPLDRGAGFEFVDKVVGGAVPRQFIPSVEKGVRSQLEKGVLAGYPMVDVRVTLVDGKSHSVDSSDMAFQTAGAVGLREAATDEDGDPAGADRRDRRHGGRGVHGCGHDRHHRPSRPRARHRLRRVRTTRSSGPWCRRASSAGTRSTSVGLAHGSGSFSRKFHGYEQMPQNLVDDAVKAHYHS